MSIDNQVYYCSPIQEHSRSTDDFVQFSRFFFLTKNLVVIFSFVRRRNPPVSLRRAFVERRQQRPHSSGESPALRNQFRLRISNGAGEPADCPDVEGPGRAKQTINPNFHLCTHLQDNTESGEDGRQFHVVAPVLGPVNMSLSFEN